jgi:hypothetical protein
MMIAACRTRHSHSAALTRTAENPRAFGTISSFFHVIYLVSTGTKSALRMGPRQPTSEVLIRYKVHTTKLVR